MEKNPDLWVNICIALAALHQYCQRHFFPEAYSSRDISAITNRFYQLPGYLEKDAYSLKISLKPPEGYPYRRDLEYAIKKLNAAQVHNDAGLQLVLRIAG